jgi:hypothetical protein
MQAGQVELHMEMIGKDRRIRVMLTARLVMPIGLFVMGSDIVIHRQGTLFMLEGTELLSLTMTV